MQSSPGTVGLALHHGQKFKLISNLLLIEGSCSLGHVAASSTPQLAAPHTLCPAQPRQAEQLGALPWVMQKRRPIRSTLRHPRHHLSSYKAGDTSHTVTKYTPFSCHSMANSDHKCSQIALQIIFQGGM